MCIEIETTSIAKHESIHFRMHTIYTQDLFITLLSMGRAGYIRLLKERKALAADMSRGLAELAARHGERLLHTPRNTISFAMTLGVSN